jgi:hypothetical protein
MSGCVLMFPLHVFMLILSKGEKIVEQGNDFVGIYHGLIKEIYRYFPAGTTARYERSSAGARIYRHK